MITIDGTMEVRIDGGHVSISVRDFDTLSRATTQLSQDNIKTLRTTLEEALIRLEYPKQNMGLGNDTLGQP